MCNESRRRDFFAGTPTLLDVLLYSVSVLSSLCKNSLFPLSFWMPASCITDQLKNKGTEMFFYYNAGQHKHQVVKVGPSARGAGVSCKALASGFCAGAIFDSNIGRHGDPHGMASERIMKGLVVWLTMHHAEIQGLDETRPLLPQFDILTDEQMREAFRSETRAYRAWRVIPSSNMWRTLSGWHYLSIPDLHRRGLTSLEAPPMISNSSNRHTLGTEKS